MPAASGLQVAFLILAFQFFSMLVTRSIAPLIGWPSGQFEILGQLVTLSFGLLVLLGIPALRRRCMAELRVPIPPDAWPGLAAALATKLAVPFAAIGIVVLDAFANQSALALHERLPSMDPARAWDFTLSAQGALRLLLLSWILGPFVEELVFRGFLYRAFERQWGWLASMALTSILFGLIHPSRIVASALGSVILICVLRRTNSLRACILVHAAYNVLVSWPFLGQVLFTLPAGEFARLTTWALPLASLALLIVAVPAWIWWSRGAALPARAEGAPHPQG